MKFLVGLILVFAVVLNLGYASTRVETNTEPTAKSHEQKNFYFLWGILPQPLRHATDHVCGGNGADGKWAATTFESSFLDVAVTVVSAGLVIPQTMRTECR